MGEDEISSLDWSALVANLASAWSLAMEIAIRAVDPAGMSKPEVLRLADKIVATPPLVEFRGRDALVWLKSVADQLIAEICRRLVAQGRVATALALVVDPRAPRQSLKTLLRALRIDRITAYGGREQAGDLQQTELLGLIDKYRKLAAEYQLELGCRIQFSSRHALGLRGTDDAAWTEFHARRVGKVLAILGPLEQSEQLRQAGRQRLRDHFAAARAAKRAGTAVSIEAAFDMGLPGPEVKAEAAAEVRHLVRTVRGRLGTKAGSFMAALARGDSVEGAAASEGISVRTARRYMRELKIIFGKSRKKN